MKNVPRAAPVKYTFYPSLSPLYLHFYLPSILLSSHPSILPSFHPSILPSFHPSILTLIRPSLYLSMPLPTKDFTDVAAWHTLSLYRYCTSSNVTHLRIFLSILSVLTIVSTGITPLVPFTGMTGARQTSPLPAQGVVVTVAAIGKRVDAASTNHRSLRLFTALSVVSCQQEFTAISNQRRSVGSCSTLIGARGPPESRCLFLLIAKKWVT